MSTVAAETIPTVETMPTQKAATLPTEGQLIDFTDTISAVHHNAVPATASKEATSPQPQPP